MTKQIFKAVCLAAIAVFGASLVIIMGALLKHVLHDQS